MSPIREHLYTPPLREGYALGRLLLCHSVVKLGPSLPPPY